MTFSSCRSKGGKHINQGEIHYDISYVGEFAVSVDLLPKSLVVSFKEDKILFEMTGLGKSGIINLANPELEIYDTYYSFMTLKKYYAAEPGESFPGFNAMDKMEIKKTSKEAVICGYNCKNAIVSFPGTDGTYNIWYTREINVKNPNVATPFEDIDGVLLSFFFKLGGSELHFNCENVYSMDIPDEVFKRRPHYDLVTKDDIVRFMNKMIKTIGS